MVVYFKDWAQIEAYKDPRFGITGLTPAEQELKDAVASGPPCVLDKTNPQGPADCLPPKPKDWSNPDKTRHIRADVLRFVLLQKVKHGEMTEAGTQLFGAQITGMLNLRDATVHKACSLIACRFENAIEADGSQFHSNIVFRHSILPAFSAIDSTISGQLSCESARFESAHVKALGLQGAQIGGGLFLRDVTAVSTIDLNGATINGSLTCAGARFEAIHGKALNLQSAHIDGSVFLSDLTAADTIDINSATIKGQLVCQGARLGSRSGIALNLQGAQINDAFIFSKLRSIQGHIILSTCKVSVLVDDAESWALVKDLTLDGFSYESIKGNTQPTFSERMNWLEKSGLLKNAFIPQPYTQLAKVYKDAGHENLSIKVKLKLEKERARYDRRALLEHKQIALGTHSPLGNFIARKFYRLGCLAVWFLKFILDWAFRFTAGYGYKPIWALKSLIVLTFFLWVLAEITWNDGGFAPNSAPILVSQDWAEHANSRNASQDWSEKSLSGRDWETFSSLAYAIDVVVPVVEIGQTSAWAPSKSRSVWGGILWWARWGFTLLGWAAISLGAAAITGVIRRE